MPPWQQPRACVTAGRSPLMAPRAPCPPPGGTSSHKSLALAELVFPPRGLAGQGFQVQGFSQASRLAPSPNPALVPPQGGLC